MRFPNRGVLRSRGTVLSPPNHWRDACPQTSGTNASKHKIHQNTAKLGLVPIWTSRTRNTQPQTIKRVEQNNREHPQPGGGRAGGHTLYGRISAFVSPRISLSSSASPPARSGGPPRAADAVAGRTMSASGAPYSPLCKDFCTAPGSCRQYAHAAVFTPRRIPSAEGWAASPGQLGPAAPFSSTAASPLLAGIRGSPCSPGLACAIKRETTTRPRCWIAFVLYHCSRTFAVIRFTKQL